MTKLNGKNINGLILKDLAPDQAEGFFEHIEANRPRYSDTIPFVSRTHSVEAMRENICRNLKRQEEGISELYTLWDGERMAGYFLIREMEKEAGWAEIGYMIGADWQGKGLTLQICRLLIEELFNDHGMTKIVICCNDDNLASIGVAKKLGFTLEGALRQHYVVNGKLRNMCYFGLLLEEWQDQKEGAKE
ncbi:putative ribosomal N-acetyltransferase YdaF [bioreactor metagenome]|uniref:Putative ribosomal N-acetyltransferase YdaF n=1 Tax=bioreactor metagenome TaxID=1076179 RepID=A0A644YP94_9ZZZZ